MFRIIWQISDVTQLTGSSSLAPQTGATCFCSITPVMCMRGPKALVPAFTLMANGLSMGSPKSTQAS